MPHSVILGTGAYAPQRVLTNADLEKMVATNSAWIVSRTGIEERRIASDEEATSDLAAEAARQALSFARVNPEQIDMIVVATVTGDTPTPSCAAFVQAKLGAVNAFAFDVGAACAGSLYALAIADQFIRSGAVRYALIIGAETLSRFVDWTNRETCVLFGDAAGAILLGASEEKDRGMLATTLRTDGALTDILGIFGGGSRRPLSAEMIANNGNKIKMRGREVYKFATRMLGDMVDYGFELKPGEAVANGQIIGWVEGFKAISDVYCVLEGSFSIVNPALKDKITAINKDSYGSGWLYEVRGQPDPKCVDVHAYQILLDQTIGRILAKQQGDSQQ